MSFMPKDPTGGGSRKERAAQLKAETEAKQSQAEAAESGEPQPGQEYTLQEGDTLDSIARQVEQDPDAIWNHDNNEQLREARGSPGELEAGDTLFIPEEQKGTGPVGQGDYVVKQGDCISSIAKDTGHFWETLWNHPDNAELKAVRQDPNVLLPGDRVTIPEVITKEESGATEERHRFVRRGEPAKLRIRLTEEGEPRSPGPEEEGSEEQREEPREDKPRAFVPYTLEVDDLSFSDKTDSDGFLQHPIPGNAKQARLIIEPGTPQEIIIPLQLGSVHPITEIAGVKQRLNNLGFDCGEDTEELTEEFREALTEFQEQYCDTVTGTLDQDTRDKLQEVHGS